MASIGILIAMRGGSKLLVVEVSQLVESCCLNIQFIQFKVIDVFMIVVDDHNSRRERTFRCRRRLLSISVLVAVSVVIADAVCAVSNART